MATASSTTNQWKYEVFLSFRGVDTRDGFTSHLHAALSRKSIITFMDNNNLQVGEEIIPAISKAIEESKIAVIVFSKEYTYSAWCLDEVAKIIQCKEICGLWVVPVFYHVDPSYLSKRADCLPESVERCDQILKTQPEKLHKWKDALTKASLLSGLDTRVIRPESKLVDKIVMDILQKLKQECSTGIEGPVGIYSRIQEIKERLSIGSSDIRFLGIWGMCGVGKTTLAEAVCNQIACEFEESCFLANFREESETYDGLIRLKEQLVSKKSMVKFFKIGTLSIEYLFTAKRILRLKSMLIVADDVKSSAQLDLLFGNCSSLGSGSRIIIISRDKQVLRHFTDDIYEVKELVRHDALQLFNQNAFKKKCLPEDYEVLTHSIVEYANDVPLALKVLGTSLFGKSKREWESAVDRLKKGPPRDLQNVLKICYDELDAEEKKIFLDIACFFRRANVDLVTKVLDGCGFSTDIALSRLVDKSLITIPESKIEMHDLLQEMGKEIVRNETEHPGKRTRLWNPEDIHQVLTKNIGTEAIEGIFLDLAKTRIIRLNLDIFRRMPNLRILKFYHSNMYGDSEEESKVQFSRSLKYLPDELRFIDWYAYPMKSLPANFQPMNLIFLKMPRSKIKRLWKREKDLEKLVEIDLSYSKNLLKVPELSKATNLAYLKLCGCKNIRSLPSTINLRSLRTLDLNDCSKLQKFPEIATNIESLYLSGTAIEEVPSSIACLSQLNLLELNYCTKLKTLSSRIFELKYLESLSLSGCSYLQNFPEIIETTHRLKALVLSGTAIKEIPSSIERLKGLSSIYLENCRNLASLPESFCNLKTLCWLFIDSCPKFENLPVKFSNLTTLEVFTAGRCNLLKLPSDLDLPCITKLDLRGNNFEKLPASMKGLPNLQCLDISSCKRLRSLPELPTSLAYIDGHDCRLLETISTLSHVLQLKYTRAWHHKKFVFTNCFKLNERGWSNFLADALRWIRNVAAIRANEEVDSFSIWYPGSQIPKWFTFQREGSSILIQLPPCSHNYWISGFAFGVVMRFDDRFEYHNSFFDIICVYGFKNYHGKCGGVGEFYSSRSHVSGNDKCVGSDHVIVFHDPTFTAIKASELSYTEAVFEFSWKDDESHCLQHCEVEKCAVLPLYTQEEQRASASRVQDEPC